MSGLLSNFRNTVLLGLALALVMVFAFGRIAGGFDAAFWQATARWIQTVAGVLWIGLLYYFNAVQIRKTPEIPGELKSAVTQYIAPEAMNWLRWSSLVAVLAGLTVTLLRGHPYTTEVLSFGFAGGLVQGDQKFVLTGLGAWLALIMLFSTWGVIWPNQKRALGLVAVDEDGRALAARIAMLGFRVNLLMSLPMLTTVAMYQTLFG